MSPDDGGYVDAQTRRVVGRAALRRLSDLVAEWQHEEAEKARLTRRFAVAIAVAGTIALTGFALITL